MIGVDLVQISEFDKRLKGGGPLMLEKMYNLSELGNLSPEHLAGVWAAKEAIRKIRRSAPHDWKDIQIFYNANGKPSARIGSQIYYVSIAHHGDYALAIAQKKTAMDNTKKAVNRVIRTVAAGKPK